MKKSAVMWLIAKEDVEIRSVWDALHGSLDCSDSEVYDIGVHKDEIELSFDYGGDESKLLYEALKWGRTEQALAPLCKSIYINIGHSPETTGEIA